MSLRIATNMPAITAQRSMTSTQNGLQKAMNQISSGSRITKAGDDAAGLSISENLKSQIRSYSQAGRNANDGISLVQVAEGSLGEISNMMTRYRELAIQASSDTVGDEERGFIDKEVKQLTTEIERIAQSTKFGSKYLLNGSGEDFEFQVGINAGEMNKITYSSSLTDATSSSLGVDSLDFSSKSGARDAIEIIDKAQTKVNGFRAELGALQNRLESTTANIASAHENLSSAKSRLSDADIAESSSELTKNSILLNATTAMLSQANDYPKNALSLVA